MPLVLMWHRYRDVEKEKGRELGENMYYFECILYSYDKKKIYRIRDDGRPLICINI